MAPAKTRIGSPPTDTTRLRMRGRDVLTEVVGRLTFAETFFSSPSASCRPRRSARCSTQRW